MAPEDKETSGSPPSQPQPRFRILFVDDEEQILKSLRRLMRRHPYDCWYAASGREGLEVLEEHPIDLVISDMRMPGMDGATFLTEVRKRWPFSVRFLLTGYADMNAAVDALNLGGINRYISKPWDDDALIEAIEEGLRIRRLEREKKRLIDQTRQQNRELQRFNDSLESMVAERTREVEKASSNLQKAFRQLEKSYDAFVRIFASIIANRPHLVKGRSTEVADLAYRVARALELDPAQTRYIYYAALLHEVGKLNVPDDVLMRSETRLTHRDMPDYKQYPVLGEMVLMPIKALRHAATLIRHHNEHYDGSGYPDGLKGNDIPLGARIIKPVRDFIGMQTEFLRESPASADEAFNYLVEQRGMRYDPEVVESMRPLVRNFSLKKLQATEYKVRVHELAPDMVLARDLVNEKGILLMVKGTHLTQPAIDRLQSIDDEGGIRMTLYIIKDDKNRNASGETP